MLQRRQFIQGAAVTGTLSLSGCIFLGLALRLIARRGFIRRSARASRSSQRGQLESLGRTGAFTAYRLIRLNNQLSRLQKVGQLLRDDENDVVAEMEGNSQVVLCRIEETVVCETRIGTRGRMQHHSPFYNTFLGYSFDEGDDKGITHTDHRQQFASRDLIKDHRILHLDQAERLKGETIFRVDNIAAGEATARLTESEYLEQEMQKAERSLTSEDRDFAKRMVNLERLNAQCQSRSPDQSCDDLNVAIEAALRSLEA